MIPDFHPYLFYLSTLFSLNGTLISAQCELTYDESNQSLLILFSDLTLPVSDADQSIDWEMILDTTRIHSFYHYQVVIDSSYLYETKKSVHLKVWMNHPEPFFEIIGMNKASDGTRIFYLLPYEKLQKTNGRVISKDGQKSIKWNNGEDLFFRIKRISGAQLYHENWIKYNMQKK